MPSESVEVEELAKRVGERVSWLHFDESFRGCSETYSTILAESLLEVTVSGTIAKTGDVKVVAWVVVASVASVSSVVMFERV